MVDMIILLYMRALRLMSIIVFLILCGLPVLYCYLKNKPRPTQDPVKLRLNLNKVTLGSLIHLKNMNYRHKVSKDSNKNSKKIAKNELESCLIYPNPSPTLSKSASAN